MNLLLLFVGEERKEWKYLRKSLSSTLKSWNVIYFCKKIKIREWIKHPSVEKLEKFIAVSSKIKKLCHFQHIFFLLLFLVIWYFMSQNYPTKTNRLHHGRFFSSSSWSSGDFILPFKSRRDLTRTSRIFNIRKFSWLYLRHTEFYICVQIIRRRKQHMNTTPHVISSFLVFYFLFFFICYRRQVNINFQKEEVLLIFLLLLIVFILFLLNFWKNWNMWFEMYVLCYLL